MYKNFGQLQENFFGFADDFGGLYRSDQRKYVVRKNVGNSKEGTFPVTGAYFGCIAEGEENTGAYSDLSIVVFPSNEKEDQQDKWMIALGVGSLGFKDDYDIVTLPGTRRMFTRCLKSGSSERPSFIKNDFLDIKTQDGFRNYCRNNEIPGTLDNALKNYGKVILASTIVNPNDSEECEKVFKRYLGLYAMIRHWPSNMKQRKAVKDATNVQDNNANEENEINEIKELLRQRKYVVLQGAPGTGKTRMAKKIISGCRNVFFTQFHAETSYSDFVYGILPDVDANKLQYVPHEGKFVEAIKKAQENPDENVYLIIDEINRANLSNVLGPAFYLFEPTMSGSGISLEICPGLSLGKLPDNLYVIATMNTADRSLAVVDFALRRRFAWYTMRPQVIQADDGFVFRDIEFNEISDIFEKYASDEELNLQPGQAYFVVSKSDPDQGIVERLKYEVMPLIKEYLISGMLPRAKDDFVNYFRNRINEEMFV